MIRARESCRPCKQMADRRSAPQSGPLDVATNRAPVEARDARYPLVAAEALVEQRAIQGKDLACVQRALCQARRERAGLLRPAPRPVALVAALEQDPAHALLEFAHVAGPRVAGP